MTILGNGMQIIDAAQGSVEWLAHRARRDVFNASEAPAMMGVSSYKTRSQLVAEKATGIIPEVDAATQRRFDDGHRFEALARAKAEELIGEDLYPVTCLNGRAGASFDGLTEDWLTNYEHKTINDALRAAMPLEGENTTLTILPLEYRIQMEQQMRVAGADGTLFMASKWDGDECVECRWCWCTPDDALWADIEAGWLQFAADVAAYVPAEPVVEVIAAPVDSLPAVAVRLDGQIAVISNLDKFGTRLREFVSGIDMAPSTDQGFADAELAVKVLQGAQDALEAAQANALAQIADVEALTRMVADLAGIARTTRLALEKAVKARKDSIRIEIVQQAQRALADHVAGLEKGIEPVRMPTIAADFAGAIKGKKTVSSCRSAADDELARAKAAANQQALAIRTNLDAFNKLSAGYDFLFRDLQALVMKDGESMAAIVSGRIAEHKTQQEAKERADKERIERETRDRVEREERDRIAVEERAKFAAEQAAAKAVAASVPVPTPILEAAPAPERVLVFSNNYVTPAAETIIEAVAEAFNVPRDVALNWMREAVRFAK